MLTSAMDALQLAQFEAASLRSILSDVCEFVAWVHDDYTVSASDKLTGIVEFIQLKLHTLDVWVLPKVRI